MSNIQKNSNNENKSIENGPNHTTILQVKNLKKHFPIRYGLLNKISGYVYAVDDISFTIKHGETLGIVGESGCGKSTVGRCLMKLYNPTAGQILFKGSDITSFSQKQLIQFRTKMQMIFQDPYSSLNPKLRVREIIGEALRVHKLVTPDKWQNRIEELLSEVGLQTDQLARYPHEFSGGQRQRIGIARSLAMNPEIIIADEPVSALDVSIQAQILNLLDRLKEKHHLSYIVIAHDLAVVEHISDRIAVMYLGKIVELASDRELYLHPKHPYTIALLSAIPKTDAKAREQRQNRKLLTGEIPSPINPPSGCRFHPRCPNAKDECARIEPSPIQINNDHWVNCHLHS